MPAAIPNKPLPKFEKKDLTGLKSSGNRVVGAILFGDDGVDAESPNGATSKWVAVDGVNWKTFFLRNKLFPEDAGAPAPLPTLLEVEIHACMRRVPVELDENGDEVDGTSEDGPDGDTKTPYSVIATLTSDTPSISIEQPWMWVRAKVTAGSTDPGNIVVDLVGIGI